MTSAAGDLRFGLRMLRKNLGLTVAAAVALGIGIGLTAFMFSMVRAVVGALPFPDAGQLVHLGADNPRPGHGFTPMHVPDVLEWQRRQRSFAGMAAYDNTTMTLSGDERPERYDGAFVTANTFALLRVRPLLGRDFAAGEDAPHAAAVAILSYDLWQTRFGGDPRILGRTVRVDSLPRTVIGVMPPGFLFPLREKLWLPLALDPAAPRGDDQDALDVVARLADGVSLARAQAEMGAVSRALASEQAARYRDFVAVVKPFTASYVENDVPAIYTALAAVAFLLLLACANVASLMMARASRRTRELAIRSALGAGRGRVLGQLLIESLLLSAGGALLGVGLAVTATRWFMGAVIAHNPPPFWIRLALDPLFLLFTLGLTVVAGLIAGLVPALQASKVDVNDVLKEEGRGAGGLRVGRFSRLIVSFEVAASCVLLVGAGLMMKSVVRAHALPLGFDHARLLTARVSLGAAPYAAPARRAAFVERLLRNLDGSPGLQSAAATSTLPTDGAPEEHFAIEGRSYAGGRELPLTHAAAISPGYFKTLGSALPRGRDFAAGDRAGAPPVAIVNQSFARREWPGQDPLGRRLRLQGPPQPWRTVVGVVPDLRMNPLFGDDRYRPQGVYVPLAQDPPPRFSLVARTAGEPLAMTPVVRRQVNAMDADLPIYFVYSMDEVLSRNAFVFTFYAALFGLFGAAALLLGAVGIFGVMSFAVSQRRQEIGIRIALGARRGDVVGLVVRQGTAQLAWGLAAGLPLAWVVSRVLAATLFEVEPGDPQVFAGVSLVLAAVALVSCLLPAQRAAEVDPQIAIQSQ
jgi:putative ABC transport system permease protein